MAETYSIFHDGKPFATQIILTSDFQLPSRAISKDSKYVLSRFAYVHRDQSDLVLECPLSHARIVLHHRLATACLHALAEPVSVSQFCKRIAGLSVTTARDLMKMLWSSQMIWDVDENGEPDEDRRTDLQCWEFHDLVFQSRSRAGRHDTPAGGTCRFAGKFNPPSVLKEMPNDLPPVSLYKPDLKKLQKTDPPFAQVQEERRSIREYSSTPISVRQLGEFLYRVGRIADYSKTQIALPGSSILFEFAPRPYPGGGALYELELYPLVQHCQNLNHGFYYYDPDQHRLLRISNITPTVEALIRDASRATTVPAEKIQVLLVISARFQRIAWKYSSMAYATILKNVGVLYQTMYLAATAMGLAPCAVGYGNSDTFARAAHTEYYTETSVGEFLLGSKRER